MLLPRFGYRAVSCCGSVLFGLGLVLSSLATSLPILFITYGVMFGIGCSMVNFSGILILPCVFKYRRGLAFGIALSGHGIGAIPMGYLTEYLVKEFGLRIAFRMMALFAIPLFVGSLVYGSTTVLGKSELGDLEEKPCSIQVKRMPESIWKNKALLAHAIALWVNAFGYYIPVVHLVNMAEGLGVSAMQATLLPSSIALSQSVGKIVFGQVFCWLRGTRMIFLIQTSVFICGLVTTLCPLMTSFVGLLVYTILFGFFDGCAGVGTFKIIEEIAGEKNINAAYAVQLLGMSFFLLIGPPIAGLLKEITGSYQVPFMLSGGFATLCVCIMFLTPILHKKAKQDEFSLEYSRKISASSKHSINSKISKTSSRSSDSGISLQIHRDEETNTSPSCSSLSSVSSSSQDASDSACDMLSIHENESIRVNGELCNSVAHLKHFDQYYWETEEEFLAKCQSTILVMERETVL